PPPCSLFPYTSLFRSEVHEVLRRSMYFMPKTTEEDDLAGVSALMQAIPDKLIGKKPDGKKDKKKPKTTRSKYKAAPKTKKRGKRSEEHTSELQSREKL